jgi:hypothetical protein
MKNKISRFQALKNFFVDLKIYTKDSAIDTLRRKIKIGYRTQPNHEFVPDQSKLGMHLAILDPEGLLVEDIMTTNPKFGNLLKMRPIFIEISHEDKDKIKIGEGHPWMYNPEEKTFIQLSDIIIKDEE